MESQTTSESVSLMNEEGKVQLTAVAKWTKFLAIIFFIFGIILILSSILLLANYNEMMNEVIKLNGISNEMIDMLEKGGKYAIGFIMILSAVLLIINGYFLYKFSTYSKQYILTPDDATFLNSFTFLKKYLYFSLILSCISLVASFISLFSMFS